MTINFHSVMDKLSRVLPGTKLIQAMRAYNSTVAGVVAQGRQVMSQVVTAYNGVVQGEIVNGSFVDATPAGMDGTINSAIMTAKDSLSLSAIRMRSLIESGREDVVPFSVTPPTPSDMLPSDSSVPVAIRGVYKGCFVDNENNLWLNTEHMAAAILRDLTAQWTSSLKLTCVDPLGMSKVATVPTVGACFVHWVSPTICLAIHSLTIDYDAPNITTEDNQYYDMYLLDASREIGARIGSIRFRFSLSGQRPVLAAAAVLVTSAPSGWFMVEPYLGPTFSFSGLQQYDGRTTGGTNGWKFYAANVASGFDIGGSIANVGGDVTISDALTTMFGDPSVVDELILSLDTILSD